MKRILIAGDSFAANWSKKYSADKSWPCILANKYCVTNVAQAGVSEYKIYKQLEKATVEQFDLVIISHTSMYRVHTKQHPVHVKDILHCNADLLIGDVEYHKNRLYNRFNKSLQSAYNYFLYHYDEQYYCDIYNMLKERIISKTPPNTLHLCAFEEGNFLNTVYNKHRGFVNHLDDQGHNKVLNYIESKINV
jgi:hypothetical protein